MPCRTLLCLFALALVACGSDNPGPACEDVCANLTAICPDDWTTASCLSECEANFDRSTRQCILSARSCSTASSSCLNEGECGDRVIDRGEECDDGNTIGGDGCSATCTSEGPTDGGMTDGCAPGEVLCDDRCSDTQTDNINCGACGEFCELDETCIAGMCQPERELEFILEWDVPGNMDLHVVRPDGQEIFHGQMRPPTGPGGLDGELLADDQTGTGPERIAFDMPTAGTYIICVNPRSISERTTWTMSVEREASLQRAVERESTESVASFNCTEETSILEFNVL